MNIKQIIPLAMLAVLSSCGNSPQQCASTQNGIVIEKQGVFSSGGRVTDPVEGEYNPTQNWLDMTRITSTATATLCFKK